MVRDRYCPKTKFPGSFYKVDIPDEAIETFLDWDKPLSGQPEIVKKFVEQNLMDKILSSKENVAKWGNLGEPFDFMKETTGGQLIQMLRNKNITSENIIGGGGAEVSNQLNNFGIKGIRYLDQGSRGAGEGTRNFVVFDPSIVKMLERNNQPVEGLLGK